MAFSRSEFDVLVASMNLLRQLVELDVVALDLDESGERSDEREWGRSFALNYIFERLFTWQRFLCNAISEA